MQPGTVTAVAVRSVRTVTSLLPEVGVNCSSPTTEWSLASACTVQDGCVAPAATVTSTRAVTLWASTTWKVTSCESTFGVACPIAAHASQASATTASTTTDATVTGRRQPGGSAYRSVSVCSTTSMLPPGAVPPESSALARH